jgi:hypothetical protein
VRIVRWCGRAAGGTHFSISTMSFGLESTEAHYDYIFSVAKALVLS